MSNFNNINKKKAKQKAKYNSAIKTITTKHHTTSAKKIQIYLLEEYHIALAESTLKRYLGLIKKEKNKKIAEKIKIAKAKQEFAKVEQDYPYTIKDPSGKEHVIMGDNHTITIGWGTQGLITYDKVDKIWRYDYDGKPFDKHKKPRAYHKPIHISSFDPSDL